MKELRILTVFYVLCTYGHFLAIAEESEKFPTPRMAGVVSYSDWMHVYLKDERESHQSLDGFFGSVGIRHIVQRSHSYGLSKLYWRTSGSASSFYPTTFDTDGDGSPDMRTRGSYEQDFPRFSPIYKKYTSMPDHIIATPESDASSRLSLSLDAQIPKQFAIRLIANLRASQDDSSGPFLYLATPNSPIKVWRLSLNKESKEPFQVYQVFVDEEGEQLETENLKITTEVHWDVHSKNREIGIIWPAKNHTALALHSLQILSSKQWLLGEDMAPDLLDLDLGPVIKGIRDESWEEHLQAENLKITSIFGDPMRRLNYASAYKSPHNPFGVGEDQISVAVREAHAAGMKIFLWFTIYEENHYGSGPLSDFVRKHPEWREVDIFGRTWRARLSFVHPEVRKYKIAMIQEAVDRYHPDGVLLDFMRRGLRDPFLEEGMVVHYPVRDKSGYSIFGYDPTSLEEFAKAHPDLPKHPPTDLPEWIDWRVKYHTQFLEEVHQALPGLPISVAVGSSDAAQSRKGDLLDWQYWAQKGLIQEIMFVLDNSKDGRPFVKPFGAPPNPVESVSQILKLRKEELPKGFSISAGIYCYKISPTLILSLIAEVRNADVHEMAWWETSSLEWADKFSNAPWQAIRDAIIPRDKSNDD